MMNSLHVLKKYYKSLFVLFIVLIWYIGPHYEVFFYIYINGELGFAKQLLGVTKDFRKTVHNLTQTMSSIQVYSGPWSHQDTPSILMLFMREQPQLSERICVKMVRAA